jgi:hypothetical protein
LFFHISEKVVYWLGLKTRTHVRQGNGPVESPGRAIADFHRGNSQEVEKQEAAMGKGELTYSLSQVVIAALSMSLAFLVLSRFTWWA